MGMEIESSGGTLKGNIGRFQLFALGFGSIVGSAWIVILHLWLSGGPGGALLGFLAGALVILAIGACFAELTTRIPVTGGEYVFATHVYGARTGFFVGWFIAFSWICVTIFEGLAVPRFIEMLLPQMADPALYHSFGAPVTRNQLLMGTIGALVIGTVNYLGGNMAARFQSLFTYGFLAITLSLLLMMGGTGTSANLSPLFPADPEASWWVGAAGVFASCAFVLNGFQAVSQAVEERSARISLATVARIIMISILAAAAFYCLAVLAASSVLPWQELAGSEMAMVKATGSLPGGELLVSILLVAAVLSLVKTWNAVFMMGARVLVALARDGMLPAWFAYVHPRTGAPTHAVLAIGGLNILGLLLGRGAISAMVDMSATSVVLCFVLCCAAVLILRRRDGASAPYTVPGGPWIVRLAILGSLLMATTALLTPFFRTGGIALEHMLLAAWAAAGLLFWMVVGRKRAAAAEPAAAPAE